MDVLLTAKDIDEAFKIFHLMPCFCLIFYYITIPRVVLPLDVQNLYVLQELVGLRKQARIFYIHNLRWD